MHTVSRLTREPNFADGIGTTLTAFTLEFTTTQSQSISARNDQKAFKTASSESITIEIAQQNYQ